MGLSATPSPARSVTAPFLRLQTRDYHECVRHIQVSSESRTFAVDTESGFRGFTHYEMRLGDVGVSLIDLDCVGEFQIVKGKPDDRYFFQFPLHGTAVVSGLGKPLTVKPGQVFITHPSQQAHAVWHGQCRELILKIGRSHFESALSADGADAPIRVPPMLGDGGVAHYLKGLIAMHLHYSDACPVLSDASVNESFGHGLMRMLMANLRQSSCADSAPAGPLPYYVKRAQEFIEREAASDITIQDIVAASGTGERSLFYGFKRWCGTTPKAYLREVRLALARRELEAGRGGDATVSQAAMNAGFASFSQFSRLYRQRYGEYPSETLKLWGKR